LLKREEKRDDGMVGKRNAFKKITSEAVWGIYVGETTGAIPKMVRKAPLNRKRQQ
jgi:hypothetical protein